MRSSATDSPSACTRLWIRVQDSCACDDRPLTAPHLHQGCGPRLRAQDWEFQAHVGLRPPNSPSVCTWAAHVTGDGMRCDVIMSELWQTNRINQSMERHQPASTRQACPAQLLHLIAQAAHTLRPPRTQSLPLCPKPKRVPPAQLLQPAKQQHSPAPSPGNRSAPFAASARLTYTRRSERIWSRPCSPGLAHHTAQHRAGSTLRSSCTRLTSSPAMHPTVLKPIPLTSTKQAAPCAASARAQLALLGLNALDPGLPQAQISTEQAAPCVASARG